MKSWALFLIKLFLITGCHGVSAQVSVPGKTITDLQGLPSNTVSALSCDSRGMIWIGTYAGLASYDGQTIVSHIVNLPGFPAKLRVDDIVLDSLDNLWIGCAQGLLHFNTHTEKFSVILKGQSVWRQVGLTRIAGKQFVFHTHESLKAELIDPASCAIEKKFQFVVGDSIRINVKNGLFANARNLRSENAKILSAINAKWIPLNKINQREIPSIQIVGDGRYLIQASDFASLIEYTESDSSFQTYMKLPPGFGAIKFITPPKDGFVFIGCSAGLFSLNLPTKELAMIQLRDRTQVNPVRKHVFSYTFDKSGNLFVGHAFSGITVIRLNVNKFESPILYPNQDHMPFYLSSLDEKFFVSRQGKGIEVYDSTFKSLRVIAHPTWDVWEVYSSLPISETQLLIGCYHNTRIYDVTSGREKIVNTEIKGGSRKNLARCDFSILTRGNGYAIFTQAKSFFRFDLGTQTVTKLNIEFKPCVSSMVYLQNDLFVVTANDNVFILDAKENKLTDLLNLSGDEIMCSLKLNNGNIALGTRGGLVICSSVGKILTKLSTSSGLVDDVIYSLAEDSGKLWMSTNRGLSAYDFKTLTIENFSEGDGLQGNEFNRNSTMQQNGFLYFGGLNGVTRFKPDNIQQNAFRPQTIITSFSVNDIRNDSALNTDTPVTLDFTQNTLSFELASLEFTSNDENTYSILLEGVDKEWLHLGTRNFVRYPSVSPGAYQFRFKSSNNDGLQGPESSIRIVITPPWYQTTVAYGCWLAIGLGFLVGLNWYINRIRNREKNRKITELERLETERTRISKDLHDNLGSQVSFISSKLSWIENQYKLPKGMDQEVGMVKKSASTVMTTLRETIWTLATPSLLNTALADKLKSYARANLTCKLEIRDDMQQEFVMPSEVVLSYYRVAQEIITNINKHSQASVVNISFYSSSEIKFKAIISDNGIGMNMSATEKEEHYGLRNIVARVKEAKGEVRFKSDAGVGLQVELEWNN